MDPLIFTPFLRPQIWGGRRLEERLGKFLPEPGRYGESWELSGHPLHVSIVAEGPLAGLSLEELMARHGADLLGEELAARVTAGARFPLLAKFLDCDAPLSVQVHPDDEAARVLHCNEPGKMEAWLILHAEPEAQVQTGFRRGVVRADVEQALDAGHVADLLHSWTPQAGDCVAVPPGTVHAARGVLFAEIQQPSDVTFRLFDWHRLGFDGLPRPLHLRQALRSIDWTRGPVNPLVPEPLPGLPSDVSGERLLRCPYFEMQRFRLQTALTPSTADRCTLWMVLEGEAVLERPASGYHRSCPAGTTILVPAAGQEIRWIPESTVTLLRTEPV